MTLTRKQSRMYAAIFEKLARKADDIYADSIKLDHDDSDTYVCPVLEKLDKIRNDHARLAGKADVTEFYPKWQKESRSK